MSEIQDRIIATHYSGSIRVDIYIANGRYFMKQRNMVGQDIFKNEFQDMKSLKQAYCTLLSQLVTKA